MFLLVPLAATLVACTPGTVAPGDTGSTNDTTPPSTGETGPQPAGLRALSDGECPDLSVSGEPVTFSSNGLQRQVTILIPDDRPAGMPVVFVWHPLGGSAAWMISVFDLEEISDATGAVIVVPDSDPDNLFEWDFWNGLDNDLTLYDDLRTCLAEQLEVDLARFTSTGFSAGGLWTSYLGSHRGDTLAAILAFSGGADPIWHYETPAYPYPALLAWGGENDTWGYGGFEYSFEETTLNYAEDLLADGHFVVLCDHGMGHTVPAEGIDMVPDWLLAHRFGEPSPFEDGDLSALPDWCYLP